MSRAELGTMNLDCNCQVLFLLVSDAYMLNYHQCFCDKPRITLLKKKKKKYLLLVVLGLRHCSQVFSSCEKGREQAR